VAFSCLRPREEGSRYLSNSSCHTAQMHPDLSIKGLSVLEEHVTAVDAQPMDQVARCKTAMVG